MKEEAHFFWAKKFQNLDAIKPLVVNCYFGLSTTIAIFI